jgi:leucyl-tRNA synthetase
MHKRFDHGAIEKKWQENWKESGIYDVGERDKSKEKEYVLVELPYPSGNLHIGHWYTFAVPDIYVRYRRMQGKQVVYPMGFDAFGLPAENAAIKRNINPREWTEGNIAHMRTQLDSMGNAFSWDKTASTIDPNYYKGTQWMFTKFFENDIAYRGDGVVNWCPHDNTVIANEQVLADGTCERCGATIEKKEMPQWKLRITDYADDLLDGLETVNWPEHIKEAQRQWIGRSKGAEIDFVLSTGAQVTVFTTRPDTLFGATYLVLAPEHAYVEKYKNQITNWDEVAAYVQAAKQKDDIERGDATKEKTGVKLEGVTATNPANGETIPVYIADYVLAGYGTGAIMAVPAHDERDFAFAEKFNLLKVSVVYQNDGIFRDTANVSANFTYGLLRNSGEFDDMTSEEAKVAITQKVSGRMTNTYRLRDWSIGRQRYWGVPIPIVYDPNGKAHIVPKEHLPWTLPEDVDCTPTGVPPLSKSVELKERTERIFGAGWTPEVETMDTFVDSAWYFLRYMDNANSEEFASLESQQNWLPVDMYFGGAEHTTMHLLYSRFWQKALHKLGLTAHAEPYIRRANHGMILGPDGNKMSKSKGNVVDPDAQVQLVGADTVKMYLAFMGPYENSSYPWDPGGVAGLRRFLERAYGLTEHIVDVESKETTTLLHKTIKKVSRDIEEFKFNTAISALMIFMNHSEKAGLTKESYLVFLRLLAPFAPHLTEEIWHEEGNTNSIHTAEFPTYDDNLALDESVTIGVQINGKHRGEITIAPDATQTEAEAAVAGNDLLAARLLQKPCKKIVYVSGRILNFILEDEG